MSQTSFPLLITNLLSAFPFFLKKKEKKLENLGVFLSDHLSQRLEKAVVWTVDGRRSVSQLRKCVFQSQLQEMQSGHTELFLYQADIFSRHFLVL